MSRFPRGLTAPARADWAALARPAPAPLFDTTQVDHLPEPARRWLAHAIAPGTPLRATVQLRMHGEIRLRAWRRSTAVQRVAVREGFVWAATARLLGLPVVGFDRYTRGEGEMHWRALGLLPVMSAGGDDVTRSAGGRYAAELLLAVPAAALDARVTWSAVDSHRVSARVHVGRDTHDVGLTVGRDGALAEVALQRWGNPDGDTFGSHRFGAMLDGEARFGGFTLPRRVTAGWHYGTDRWANGQFIRYTVDDARYS
jgi:hypothetical protein